MKRASRVLALSFVAFGWISHEAASAAEGPLILPAPRWARPGQPPRPYRHFDFTQPSPYGVVTTYFQNGRMKQIFSYPGYKDKLPEPAFLYYGDPQVRNLPGHDMGAPTW